MRIDKGRAKLYNPFLDTKEGPAMEHCHIINDLKTGKCVCGAVVCRSRHPKEPVGCMLEKGHDGPHRNPFFSLAGEWTNGQEAGGSQQ